MPVSFKLVASSKPLGVKFFASGYDIEKLGARSTGSVWLAAFWGCGNLVTKSEELFPLLYSFPANSSLPPVLIEAVFELAFALRSIEFVLDGAVAGPVPLKPLAVVPNPTKSITEVLAEGLVPVSAMVELQRATLPAVALMAIVPVASGVGKLAVPPVPAAC